MGCVENLLDLESLRESLVQQEDTVIFSLIERAKYPINSRLYEADQSNPVYDSTTPSLFLFFLKESEALQAKAGRYVSPEEQPFFPDDLPSPVLQTIIHNTVLHFPGADISINDKILRVYLEKVLPLIAVEGDDEKKYAAAASADLTCLQALSRRIHYGKFVAEVTFRDAAQDYIPAIQGKDREALMNLLTFESIEERIKKRVEKKASTFGGESKMKVEPCVVSKLYGEWVIPLTKLVQVEYLLRRLD